MTSRRGSVARKAARVVVPRSARPLGWRVFVKPFRPSMGATAKRWRWPVDRYRYQPVRRRLLREHDAPYTEDLWVLLGERWSEWG